MNDARLEFIDFMRSQGVHPANPADIEPGRFIRFDIDGERRGKKSGFCIFHDDEFPVGEFGDLRQHDKHAPLRWSPKRNPGRELTDQERQALIERNRQRAEQRRQEIARIHAETAAVCQRIWADSGPASPDHPYLKAKQVKPHGLKESKGSLLVPVVKQGKITSLQFILAEPDPESGKNKFFKRGGEINGCYSSIGPKPSERVVICEGWATGATIHEATGLPVIVAFDAGNLKPVATYFRATFPQIEIIVAADDDRFTKGNPGVQAALEACSVSNGIFRRPSFASDDGKPTDFNDLAARLGLSEVEHQIRSGQPSFDLKNSVEVTQQRAMWSLLEPFPHMSSTRGGKPLATIENVKDLLERMNVTVRYNVISKQEEILVPGAAYSVDNQKNASYAQILSWCNLAKMPTGNLESFLTQIADSNQYNPVASWITSKPWDGTSRLKQFFDTVTTRPELEGLKSTYMRRWLISAVAAAFEPFGVSAHGVLVFQGSQGLGKTSWFKRLAPSDLKVIADGKTLRLDDKDSVFQIVSNWLVELGELDATFKKSDIANLKSFITKDFDVIRRPFARKESEYARRTVFFASVNQEEFLADPTGNRRYWTIPCLELDYRHTVDMQQLWAEVYQTLYLKKEPWILSPDEEAAAAQSNEEFTIGDPIEDRIREFYDWKSSKNWRWATVLQILHETGIDRPARAELNAAGAVVRRLNGDQRKRVNGKRLLWVPQNPHTQDQLPSWPHT